MKRILIIILVLATICFVMASSESFPFQDEEIDEVVIDDLDDDENENFDANVYLHRRLRLQKRCRDGRKCRSKYDCDRGGCSVREFPTPVKVPYLSCRNGDGCVRFCRDGSKCKERNN